MSREKSPAFQFYPKDYLSDPRVRAMSFEQRGLYWEAVSICWLEGSLPSDLVELAAILGCSAKRLEAVWARISQCFEAHGDRLTHKRLDKERAAQAQSRDRRTEAARKRWEKDAMHMQCTTEEPSTADAKQCSPSSSPSSSPSASSTAVRETRQPSIIARSENINWAKRHSSHITGFCDWVCLDEQQASEFAAKIPGEDYALKLKQLREWALHIRESWQGRLVPDGSHFDFWRNRWTETHGGSRPANATLKAVRSAADLDEAFK